MSDVTIRIGDELFDARFLDDLAPLTCARFRALLPWSANLIHVRWSGEAMWVPMGEMALDLPPENATSYPSPGQILLYPGGLSETEILIAYGPTHFASKAGPLAGNHVLTVMAGAEHLRGLGERTLWHGALPIRIERA